MSIVFIHPFTMTVSGPTSCGKTTLMKKILQQAQYMISPPLTRIIWLYKRWQPLYDELRQSVTPPIEFIEGIPQGLESDTFISTKDNNLVILDDLMSTAGKDPRVTELFTEGSHHRNLSVIAINQNLYFNKDPTQRRNSHYMIVFNNPVDRQPMMTLARQMYPENPMKFMQEFQRATKYPFGYLVIDLKPFTSENARLLPNALEHTSPPNSFMIGEDSTFNNREESTQPQHGRLLPNAQEHTNPSFMYGTSYINREESMQSHFIPDPSTEHIAMQSRNMEHPMDEKPACLDCGVVYASKRDLDRHTRSGCPEEEDDSPPHKKLHVEDTDTDDDDSAFDALIIESYNFSNRLYSDKVNDLMEKQGMTQSEGEKLVSIELRPKHLKRLQDLYINILLTWGKLKHSPTHKQIDIKVEKNMAKGYTYARALKKAVRGERGLFNSLLDEASDYESSDENGGI